MRESYRISQRVKKGSEGQGYPAFVAVNDLYGHADLVILNLDQGNGTEP